MKAVGLFSGGLDSALAIKLVQEQGIDVIAFNFVSSFWECGKSSIPDLAKKLKVPLKQIKEETGYTRLVRKPKYGYGKNMNPCIDCKIYILKKAKEYAKKVNAKFIFTGEVLGQRPMSQHYNTLMLIEKEAGLKGKLLRPLSAGLLPETEAEKKGWIDRKKLLKLQGRTRTSQLELARKFKIDNFKCGGSGCKLTDKEYSKKLRDLFRSKKRILMNDIKLLNFGRHFRYKKNKIIVGRNKLENEQILKLKQKTDIILEVKSYMGPTTLLRGKADKKVIELAAKLTARYSDAEKEDIIVKYKKGKLNKEIVVNKIENKEIEKLRIK